MAAEADAGLVYGMLPRQPGFQVGLQERALKAA